MVRVFWNNRSFYMGKYLSENLDNYVKGVLTKNTSAVIIFDGRSGLGKTTLSCQTGCYIANRVSKYLGKKPLFTLDSLAWTPDDFIEKLKKAKKGDVVVMDESMILSNRSAMSSVNKMVIIMMSLIRSKQIFVIFNVNSIFDLDKNLPLHRADACFHLYAVDDKFAVRGRYFAIPAAKGKLKNLYILGKKYYDYSKARPAFRDRFDDFFPFSNTEYEKRKQEAIENYFIKETKTGNKFKEQRDRLIFELYKLDVSFDKIALISNLSSVQVRRIVSSLK